PNKEPAKSQKRLLDRKSPIQVRIRLPPAESLLRTGWRPARNSFVALAREASTSGDRVSQLDTKLQPLRVGVVEDSSGVPVGRVRVQEGDGLEGASEAMLQAR